MPAVVRVRDRGAVREPDPGGLRLGTAMRGLSRVHVERDESDDDVQNALRYARGGAPAHRHDEVELRYKVATQGTLAVECRGKDAHDVSAPTPVPKLVEPLLEVEGQLENVQAGELAHVSEDACVAHGYGSRRLEVSLPGAHHDAMERLGRARQCVRGVAPLPVRLHGRGVTIGWRLGEFEGVAWEPHADGILRPAKVYDDSRLSGAPFGNTTALGRLERKGR